MSTTSFDRSKNKEFSLICPDCKRSTHHRVLHSVEVGESDPDYWWTVEYQIVQCKGCLTASFRSVSSNSEDCEFSGDELEAIYTVKLYPHRNAQTISAKNFYNVPLNIRRIYKETIDCFNNEIFTLCAAGVRAIIEGLCAEEKIHDGNVEITKKDGTKEFVRRKNLEGKIAGLYERGLLTKKHSEILHEHRFLGNEALHELRQPSFEELLLAIQIIEQILGNIYELPDLAEELRLKREIRSRRESDKSKKSTS